jgi:peroxiredoxin
MVLLDPEQRADTRVVAVSVDGREDLRQMVANIWQDGRAPDITFLSDPDHRVIDRSGVVRWKFVETDYRIRPTSMRVIEALVAVRRSAAGALP